MHLEEENHKLTSGPEEVSIGEGTFRMRWARGHFSKISSLIYHS